MGSPFFPLLCSSWRLALRAFVAAAAAVLAVATVAIVAVVWVLSSQLDRLQPWLADWLSGKLHAQVALEGLAGSWEGTKPTLVVPQWRMTLPAGAVYRGSLRLTWDGQWHTELSLVGPGVEAATVAFAATPDGWRLRWQLFGWEEQAARPLVGWVAELFQQPLPHPLPARVTEFTGESQGQGTVLTRLAVSFRGLTFPATADLPGVTYLSGEVIGNRQSGQFRLFADRTELLWPAGWFGEEALALTDLNWQGQWRYLATEGYALTTEQLVADTPQGQIVANGTVSGIGRGETVQADWHTVARNVELAAVIRYLPAQAVGQETIAWLKRAFPTGRVPVVTLAVTGPLAAFPFREGQGRFEVDIPVRDLVLRFAPDWPPITIELGRVRFVNEALAVSVDRARTRQMVLESVAAAIPDLESDFPVLLVQGEASGVWRGLIDYLASSPLARLVPLATLRQMQGQGQVRLPLSLTIPLYDGAEVGVAGRLHLSRFAVPATVAGGLPLKEGEATIAFDAQGVTAAEGRALWGEMPVAATWLGGDPPRLAVTGQLAAVRLASLLSLPTGWVGGTVPVVGEVTLAERATRLRLTSSGQGLALRLPEPFFKAAKEEWQLAATLLFTDKGWQGEGQVGERLRWQRLASGAWAVAVGSAPLPEPAPEGAVAVAVDRLDLDGWLDLPWPAQGGQSLPRMDLRLPLVTWRQRLWHDVSLTVTPSGAGSRFQLTSAEAVGNGTIRLAKGKVAAIDANFDRLWWPEAHETNHPADAPPSADRAAPSDWPQARITIADLRWGARQIGSAALTATQVGESWQVSKLTVRPMKGWTIDANGRWAGTKGAPLLGASSWQVTVTSSDWGRGLDALWGVSGLEGGNGTVEANLVWPGSPLDFSWEAVTGTGRVVLNKGVFTAVDPGAGRLLSVLSLPMVLRRLQFDFRDLAAKGLAFDRIEGSFALGGGFLTTADLTIDAPVALTQLAGSIDLIHETQQLEVRVVPRLGNTAATALTFVNPVAGLLTYLAQQVVGDPLGGILVQRYRISGSWAEPKVVPLAAAGEVSEE